MRSLLLVLAWLALATAGVQAQARSEAEVEALTRQLAGELRCPVCQGLSIEDSPTELSLQMKSVIRQQLEQGRSPEEVREYFVDRYGEWILLEPRPQGFNLVVYLLPFLGLLAGAAFLVVLVRRWTRPPAGGEPATDPAWMED